MNLPPPCPGGLSAAAANARVFDAIAEVVFDPGAELAAGVTVERFALRSGGVVEFDVVAVDGGEIFFLILAEGVDDVIINGLEEKDHFMSIVGLAEGRIRILSI